MPPPPRVGGGDGAGVRTENGNARYASVGRTGARRPVRQPRPLPLDRLTAVLRCPYPPKLSEVERLQALPWCRWTGRSCTAGQAGAADAWRGSHWMVPWAGLRCAFSSCSSCSSSSTTTTTLTLLLSRLSRTYPALHFLPHCLFLLLPHPPPLSLLCRPFHRPSWVSRHAPHHRLRHTKKITARHISSNPSIRGNPPPLGATPSLFLRFLPPFLVRRRSLPDGPPALAIQFLAIAFGTAHRLDPKLCSACGPATAFQSGVHQVSLPRRRPLPHADTTGRPRQGTRGPARVPSSPLACCEYQQARIRLLAPSPVSIPPWCWPSSASANAAHAPTNTPPSVLVCPRHDSIASRRPVLSRNSSRRSGGRLFGPPPPPRVQIDARQRSSTRARRLALLQARSHDCRSRPTPTSPCSHGCGPLSRPVIRLSEAYYVVNPRLATTTLP